MENICVLPFTELRTYVHAWVTSYNNSIGKSNSLVPGAGNQAI